MPWLGQGSARFADLVSGLVIHISFPFLNQQRRHDCTSLQNNRTRTALFPIESEPLHVLLNGVNILNVFLHRVRIIEPQVRPSAEFIGQCEIDPYGLGMSNMQVAVRLRRKAGNDFLDFTGLQVFGNNIFMKLEGCPDGSPR